MIDTTPFKNMCPVCTQKLTKDKNTVSCSDHYQIELKIFNKAWLDFDKSKQTQDDELVLMKALLDSNTAENAPSMRYVLHTDERTK